MPTTFATPINDAAGVLASPRAIGGSSITLQAGQGNRFGYPSPSAPIRITLQRANDDTVSTILLCHDRSGDILFGLAVAAGSADHLYSPGDLCEIRITAETVADLHSAINATEVGIVGLSASVATKAGAADLAAHAGDAGNPHATTAAQVGAYSASEINALLTGLATVGALTAHVTDTINPHAVTKAQVGLGNVDNTSDAAKPLSTAATSALAGKSNVGHTHLLAQIADFAAGLATALASWVGSAAITTVGTITTGTWQAGKIAVGYLGSGSPSAGKYLDGGGSWTTLPSGGGSALPGGSDRSIQFNDAGAFGGGSGLAYTGASRIQVGTTSNGTISLGPYPGAPEYAGFWCVAPGDINGSNYFLLANANEAGRPVTYFNAPGGDGLLQFRAANVAALSVVNGPAGPRVAIVQSTGGAPASAIGDVEAGLTVSPGAFNFSALAVLGLNGQTAPLVALEQLSSTGAIRKAGVLDAGWSVSTDASRQGYASLSAVDWAGTREGIRVLADGTRAKLGFFGATPVAKPTTPVTLADVIARGQSLGLWS